MGLTGLIDSLLNWIDAISSGRTQAAIIAIEAVASILGAIQHRQHLQNADAARTRRRRGDDLVIAIVATQRRSLHGLIVFQILKRDQSAIGLRRRCQRIIWLNPLIGWRDYSPLARGMQAALPYVDLLAPAHNLESLAALEPYLSRI